MVGLELSMNSPLTRRSTTHVLPVLISPSSTIFTPRSQRRLLRLVSGAPRWGTMSVLSCSSLGASALREHPPPMACLGQREKKKGGGEKKQTLTHEALNTKRTVVGDKKAREVVLLCRHLRCEVGERNSGDAQRSSVWTTHSAQGGVPKNKREKKEEKKETGVGCTDELQRQQQRQQSNTEKQDAHALTCPDVPPVSDRPP